jgi:amino-acid N-acetyltransferase
VQPYFHFLRKKCGEIAECRGHGQGDKSLGRLDLTKKKLSAATILMNLKFLSYWDADYMEKKAASLGLERLFLLTTHMADWYPS